MYKKEHTSHWGAVSKDWGSYLQVRVPRVPGVSKSLEHHRELSREDQDVICRA